MSYGSGGAGGSSYGFAFPALPPSDDGGPRPDLPPPIGGGVNIPLPPVNVNVQAPKSFDSIPWIVGGTALFLVATGIYVISVSKK
jgi:hypothetical protein